MNASEPPAPASTAMRDAPRNKPKTARLDTFWSALGIVSPRFAMLIHLSCVINCGTAHVYGHLVTLHADACHSSKKVRFESMNPALSGVIRRGGLLDSSAVLSWRAYARIRIVQAESP